MNNTLYIYRASAGSGKTFTLAVEYIKLLVQNPDAYKRILAVTFTNKATGEMKERIMSQLYGIANALPSSDGYMKKLCEALPKYDEKKIRKQAGTALQMILHDYGHFRIQTIDAFFQTILRGVARELDLSGDIEITIDSSKLLNEAVDLLIKQLTPTGKEMGWLVEYIEEHLANDKAWRIKETIKQFSENILKEEYQERGAELRRQIESNDGALLADYRKTLRKIEEDIKKRATELGNKIMAIFAANGLTEENIFQKKKGAWGYAEKLQQGDLPEPNSYVQACIDTPQKISKAAPPTLCEEIATLLAEGKKMHQESQPILNSCTLSLARFHQLRLLNSIGRTLQEENTRENRFLLAQTTYLLSKMITNSSTFIFEKIGSEVSHIFIDEFQDTSKLQWKCFHVLLEEVMAHGTKNLIVGDVKQSIYRWRNSDWNILNHIEKEFPAGTIADYATSNGGQARTVNYRSERRIIEFNNALFEQITKIATTTFGEQLGDRLHDLVKAYSDVKQDIPAGRPAAGYAEIRMIEKGEEPFNETVYAQLMETLRRLITVDGVKPGDITILVRTKNVVPEIANRFNEAFKNEGLSIVSDDAYRLSASSALKILIAAMRHIATPEDRINTVHLAVTYNAHIKNRTLPQEEFLNCKNIGEYLPAKFTEAVTRLSELPVYELIEQLIILFELSSIEGEEAFIYSFMDYATQFLNSGGASDLSSFIAAWDEELYDKSIPADNSDSVRIMTIHKSKGLEFHTVIIPFCNWTLTGDHRALLWCSPQQAPFDQLSLLPIDASSTMLNSIYSEEYNHEYLFQLVDNINLLYVACTRASKNLFIFSEAKKTDSKKKSRVKYGINELIQTAIESLPLDGACTDEEKSLFTYGTTVSGREEGEKTSDNPFTQKATREPQPFVSYDCRVQFRQSRNLARFMAKDKEEEERMEHLVQGTIMHELLSQINTGDELDRQLDRMQMEGLVSDSREYGHIKKLLVRALENPRAREWFSGRYRLFNECTILFKNGNKYEQRRPDRVMVNDDNAIVVDFKFGREREEYSQQVKEYINLLRQMGYKNVQGYLWYVYTNKIEEV